ncbi:hypothetical protein MAB47J26_14507 [Mycobacteroides abscessus 47J26]|nr:hypothetical protein MAB47J26_14507 [Mycobacteroides abscessus 47J26]
MVFAAVEVEFEYRVTDHAVIAAQVANPVRRSDVGDRDRRGGTGAVDGGDMAIDDR